MGLICLPHPHWSAPSSALTPAAYSPALSRVYPPVRKKEAYGKEETDPKCSVPWWHCQLALPGSQSPLFDVGSTPASLEPEFGGTLR